MSSDRSLAVVHLIAPASFGGLERVVHALSIGQRDRGYDVLVVALLDAGRKEPQVLAELRDAGVRVLPLVHPPRSYRAQRRSIGEICESIQPDVIHSHGYLPDGLSASLGRRVRAVRVSTVHGFTGGALRNRFNEWLQRQSYRWFDAVVAVSRKLAGDLSGSRSLRGKLRTVPNAWMPAQVLKPRDTARAELGLSSPAFTIGWVGRVSREKGLDVLIDALPALKDIPFQLVVIGDGIDRPHLQRKVAELGLAECVRWAGELRDAASLMPALDVMVISSRTEGTPITLFEAMYAGIPVVSTSVGGIPDVVSDAEAVLVPTSDPSALATAIRNVHDNKPSAAERVENARNRLTRDFASGPWVDCYDRLYRAEVAARGER